MTYFVFSMNTLNVPKPFFRDILTSEDLLVIKIDSSDK